MTSASPLAFVRAVFWKSVFSKLLCSFTLCALSSRSCPCQTANPILVHARKSHRTGKAVETPARKHPRLPVLCVVFDSDPPPLGVQQHHGLHQRHARWNGPHGTRSIDRVKSDFRNFPRAFVPPTEKARDRKARRRMGPWDPSKAAARVEGARHGAANGPRGPVQTLPGFTLEIGHESSKHTLI